MIRILDVATAESFVNVTRDTKNFIHKSSYMWGKHKIPALVSGMELLTTAIAEIPEGELPKINHGIGYFQQMVPMGSSVDFFVKKQKNGFRLHAQVNGGDALSQRKGEQSYVDASERRHFNEGESLLCVLANKENMEEFKRITCLPDFAVPSLYAVALSSFSLTVAINRYNTPSWEFLRSNLKDSSKDNLATYDFVEFYLPAGMRSFDINEELVFRSSIRNEGKPYVIDTICSDRQGVICGVRASLRIRSQKMIIEGISKVLEEVKKSGDYNTLREAIERREQYLRAENEPI